MTDSTVPSQTTRILIVDDHPITRDGIVQLIQCESDLVVSAQADNAAQAMASVTAEPPDLAIVDLNLPDKSGLELIKDFKAMHPGLLVLVLSMHDEKLYAERALRAGAAGYIMKVEGGRKLIAAIRRVLAGGIYLSEAIAGRVVHDLSGPGGREHDRLADLSDRELEIFRMFGAGTAAQAIADRLHVSSKTVEAHRLNIKRKLRIGSAQELIAFAARWLEAEGGAK